MKIPPEYEEFPGNHNWEYWDRHVQEAIEFHTRTGVAASAATGGR